MGGAEDARRVAADDRGASGPSPFELTVTVIASAVDLPRASTRAVAAGSHRGPTELPEPVVPRRFELVRCLGYGGMGVVYEAIDRQRGVRVALKRLRDASPDCLRRFQREFQCLAGPRHPSCVQAHELIEEDGRWFISMELIDGVDFLTWVGSGEGERPFDERRLRHGLAQLGAALAALHASGKVHRDVKSANVLVTATGRVVLVDFGLVADLDEGAAIEGESVGTPAYVAPEQAAAAPPHPAADWYSLGVLLYRALTGALPFAGAATDVLRRKAAEDPLPPHERVAGVPDDLERLCVALLARDPAARPGAHDVLAVGDREAPPRGERRPCAPSTDPGTHTRRRRP